MPSIRKGNTRRRRAERRAVLAAALAGFVFGYELADAQLIAVDNHHSFYVPCQARLDALAPGDGVKLIFEPLDDMAFGERMWVLVESVDGDRLTGILVNEPLFPGMGVRLGSAIAFERRHVIQIVTERADDPEETNTQDESVFHRCLMDARVYHGEVPLARISRTEPQPADYANEMFPWSGWRLEGEGFTSDMPTEIGTPIIALRRQDDFTHLLASPEGSTFERVGDEWRAAA